MSAPREILEAALKLDPRSRVELAQKLWSSVDDEAASLGPAEVDPDFARELERRIREVESGEVEAIPLADVKARIANRRRGR